MANRYITSQLKGLLYVEVPQGGHSSFHVQTALFSFVNQLQLRNAYFERYWRNWLSFTELNEHFLIYLFRSPRYRQWNFQSCHHCVQHPWKLTSMDFWSSRNERKPLSKKKCVLRECIVGISEMVNARAFKPLPLYSAPPENLLVGISGALGTKESQWTPLGKHKILQTNLLLVMDHCYWCLLVKNGNFTLLLTSSGQEWQFHIGTGHLAVKNGNFTFLLTSCGQAWQFTHLLLTSCGQDGYFHIATDI